MISFIEHELKDSLIRQAAPEAPASRRISRQVKHFPVQPQVSITDDDKGTYFVLSVSAADRPGLLYTIATVLAAHGTNLHTAKIVTLGERVEDTFLITGEGLRDSDNRIRLERDLLNNLND